MFEIEYKGANSVIISTKKAKLVVDPKLSNFGLKNVSVKGAIELATEQRFSIQDSDASLIIDSPGEYGVADFDIYGISAKRYIYNETEGNMSTIYRIKIGEARIGIIGNIDKKLSDEQLEGLGVIDVLIIPVGGGGYTLNANDSADLVRMINPKIVVPTHYNDKLIKYEVPQEDLSLFVNELGVPVETMAKYKLKQQFIAQTTISIVELTRS